MESGNETQVIKEQYQSLFNDKSKEQFFEFIEVKSQYSPRE